MTGFQRIGRLGPEHPSRCFRQNIPKPTEASRDEFDSSATTRASLGHKHRAMIGCIVNVPDLCTLIESSIKLSGLKSTPKRRSDSC